MQRGLPMLDPDSFYTTAGGGLGFGLPAAVGIALARRQDKVIALLGDGSAMYAIQGLFSAAKLGVAVSFLIVNNRSYAALRQFGGHFGLEKVEGSDLDGLDFAPSHRAMGLRPGARQHPKSLKLRCNGRLTRQNPRWSKWFWHDARGGFGYASILRLAP
jgi:benzoylformate decarboxylase